MFGYAATFEVHNVATALIDRDNSQESRDLVSRFTASPSSMSARSRPTQRARRARRSGEVPIAIQIRSGFAEHLRKGQTAPVQLIVDGTNSNTALIALGYVTQSPTLSRRITRAIGCTRLAPPLVAVPSVELEERPWYNPGLRAAGSSCPG